MKSELCRIMKIFQTFQNFPKFPNFPKFFILLPKKLNFAISFLLQKRKTENESLFSLLLLFFCQISKNENEFTIEHKFWTKNSFDFKERTTDAFFVFNCAKKFFLKKNTPDTFAFESLNYSSQNLNRNLNYNFSGGTSPRNFAKKPMLFNFFKIFEIFLNYITFQEKNTLKFPKYFAAGKVSSEKISLFYGIFYF